MAKKKINLNVYGLSIINNENKRVLLNSLMKESPILTW